MLQKLHKRAKTNYAIRSEIKASSLSVRELALEYDLNPKTILKWKHRDVLEDKPSRPITLQTKISKEHESLIVYERKAHKKSLFEIWDTLHETVPDLYTMKIYRVLFRWGLNILPNELKDADRLVKKFRKYTVGYLHIDLIYTPYLMTKNGKERHYIFSCIDRVSKVAYVMISSRKTKYDGKRFLHQVLGYYPYKINYILTDNGCEFTNKKYKGGKAKHIHPFTKLCKSKGIQHRTTKIKHPWTNGMVERFNQKLKNQVTRKYLFEDVDDLQIKLIEYVNRYNFEIKLIQLGGRTPIDNLKEKYQSKLKTVPQRIVT